MNEQTQKGHNVASNNFYLKCHRCSYEWEYDGKKKPAKNYPVYVSCPRCKTSVELAT